MSTTILVTRLLIAGPKRKIRRGLESSVDFDPFPKRGPKALTQQTADRFGSTDDKGVPADPAELAKEVERLKEGQQKMMEALTEAQPGAASDGDWAKAATKGTLDSLAGAGAGAAVGAAAGSVVPVVGTATGAAVGAAVSGFASDMTKETVDFLANNRPQAKGVELERMYEDIQQMYHELKETQHKHGGKDLPNIR